MKTIGERMLLIRVKKKWTQKQLGEALGESTNTVFKFESAKTKPHKVNEIRVDEKLKALEAKIELDERSENE